MPGLTRNDLHLARRAALRHFDGGRLRLYALPTVPVSSNESYHEMVENETESDGVQASKWS